MKWKIERRVWIILGNWRKKILKPHDISQQTLHNLATLLAETSVRGTWGEGILFYSRSDYTKRFGENGYKIFSRIIMIMKKNGVLALSFTLNGSCIGHYDLYYEMED